MAIDSPGKSGAKFYLSYDRRFIIKTLQTEEVEQMHVLLKHYHPVCILINHANTAAQDRTRAAFDINFISHTNVENKQML